MLNSFSALLASTALLLAGMGLQNTLIGVRAEIEGFSGAAIGLTMAAFFAGYVAGGRWAPRLINRVGHIRTFGVLATFASAAALIYAVFPDTIVWMALRFVSGLCIAGLYLVIESWLNGGVDNAKRGQLLSIYFTLNFGVIAAAQYLLLLAPPSAFELFILSSVLLSLALAPVGLTKTTAPAPALDSKLSFSTLYRTSPLGVVGAFLAGLTNGAFWSLGAVYVVQAGMAEALVPIFMSAVIIGGMIAQAPVGRLSDRMDRRIVIVASGVLLAALTAAFAATPTLGPIALAACGAAIGAVLLSQYPLCVAHTNDFAAPGDVVQVSSGLLILFGIGSAVGPVIAGPAMDAFGPSALFAHIAVFAGLLGVFGLWRMMARAPAAEAHREAFEPAPMGLGAPPPEPRAA